MATVEITIKKKRTPAGSGSKRRSGIAAPRDRRQLGRRRQQKAQGIRFYDLGQRANGADIYHGYLLNVIDGWNPQLGSESELIPTFNALRDEILAVGSLSNFMPISKNGATAKSLRLQFDVFDDYPENLSQYEGNTLTISETELEGFSMIPSVRVFTAGSRNWPYFGSTLKITNAPSYSADPVAFEPSVNMDVGIVPALAHQRGATIRTGGSVAQDVLNGIYATTPRSALPFTDSVDEYEINYDLWRVMKASPDARAFTVSTSGPPGASISPAGFPHPGDYPPPPGTPFTSGAADFGDDLDPEDIPGRLVLIVKKGGGTFYFWTE